MGDGPKTVEVDMGKAILSVKTSIAGKAYAKSVEIDTTDERSCNVGLRDLINATNMTEKHLMADEPCTGG